MMVDSVPGSSLACISALFLGPNENSKIDQNSEFLGNCESPPRRVPFSKVNPKIRKPKLNKERIAIIINFKLIVEHEGSGSECSLKQ